MAFVNSNVRAGGHFSYIRFVLRLRIPLAIATMVFAVLGLTANFLGVGANLQPLGVQSATHPFTALCLLGVGFGAFRLRRFGQTPVWRYLIGAVIIAICASRLMQAEVSQTTGAPALDIFGPIAGLSGRFSVESAVTLGAFGLAMILRQGLARWGVGCLLIGFATISTTLLEVSYGLTFINGDVGVFSLLGMICAAAAMTTIYIHRPLIRVGFLVGHIGTQLRILALAAVIVPWAAGLFLHNMRDIGPNAAPLEASMVLMVSWSLLMILFVSAAYLENTAVVRRKAERDLEMLARTDPQTQALNRQGMSEVLDRAWVEFKSSGAQFGMLLLDVDYFRRVNETFGRDGSENVLERVAATLQPQLRDHDALGRWSAEEFLILLKIKDQTDLDVVIERLHGALQDVSSPFSAALDRDPISIDAAFGAAHMHPDDRGPADMMIRADMALHLSKNSPDGVSADQLDLDEDADTMVFNDLDDEDQASVIAA